MENSSACSNDGEPQQKKKKYNPSTLQFSARSERYKSNTFAKNMIEEEKDSEEKNYNFYIRPFIPFWRVQQMNFETINAIDEIPKVNESTYSRYVLHDLVRTWIAEYPVDKSWFDREDVYDLLKEDLIQRIQSKLPSKGLPKNIKGIPEFEIRRHLILDCWMLYQYKYFKVDTDTVSLNHFPLWNSSNEFKFNLYVEVKRTSEDSPLREFDRGKRLWLKVDDISNELYQQHYVATEFNKDIKILSTEQYVPEFLKKLCIESTGDGDFEYVQNKNIIERPRQQQKSSTKKRHPQVPTNLDEMTEDNSNNQNTSETFEFTGQSSQVIVEELMEKLKEKEQTIASLSLQLEQKDKDLSEALKNAVSAQKHFDKMKEKGEKTIESLSLQLKQKDKDLSEALKRADRSQKHFDEMKENDQKALSLQLKQKEKDLNEALKKAESAQKHFDKMKENDQKTIESLSLQLKQKNVTLHTFLGPISNLEDLSSSEKKLARDCIDFININSSLRSNLSNTNKAIKKKIASINHASSNDNVEKMYKKFYGRYKTASNAEKVQISQIFKKRVADDQFKINSEKAAIRKLMLNRYKREYADVLAKMSQYCNSVDQNAEIGKVIPEIVPEKFFDVDIVDFFKNKGLKFDEIDIQPMSYEDTKKYAKYFPI